MELRSTLLGGFLLLATPVAMAADSDETSLTTISKNARKAGFTTCLATVDKVANHVVRKNPHTSHDIWATQSTDERIFSSFVLNKYSDGEGHARITVSRGKDGTCSAEYSETLIWDQSCSVVREKSFSALKFVDALDETSTRFDGEGFSVYMTPILKGVACMTTKREVLFNQ